MFSVLYCIDCYNLYRQFVELDLYLIELEKTFISI